MNKPVWRAVLVALAGLAVLFSIARIRYSGTVSLRLPGDSCNAGLWKHVYEPERLRVLADCTAIEGGVVSLNRGSDGDLHIALDPDDAAVLNLVNALHGQRHLVVEIICEHEAERDDIKAVCAGLAPSVPIPSVGERIRVTGSYVTDRDIGWNEVHPVTRIDKLQ